MAEWSRRGLPLVVDVFLPIFSVCQHSQIGTGQRNHRGEMKALEVFGDVGDGRVVASGFAPGRGCFLAHLQRLPALPDRSWAAKSSGGDESAGSFWRCRRWPSGRVGVCPWSWMFSCPSSAFASTPRSELGSEIIGGR